MICYLRRLELIEARHKNNMLMNVNDALDCVNVASMSSHTYSLNFTHLGV